MAVLEKFILSSSEQEIPASMETEDSLLFKEHDGSRPGEAGIAQWYSSPGLESR
jgi:hypothetical protein